MYNLLTGFRINGKQNTKKTDSEGILPPEPISITLLQKETQSEQRSR